MEKKIVKYVRHYDDGSSDFVEGEFLENFKTNLDIANAIVGTRSYIQFKPVEWTLQLGGTLTNDNRPIQQAIESLDKEIKDRQQAYIRAHNMSLDDEQDEEQERINEFDLEDGTYDDMIDFCELYHQIRIDKR